MSWLLLISISALVLGIYDVCKKHAVASNAVMPVLWLATAFGTLTVILWQAGSGKLAGSFNITGATWFFLFLKSVLVACSWICAYYAMRALPITIVAPIRGSQPLWTVLGAFIILKEFPTALQLGGIIIIVAGYFLFSVLGKREGIRFHADRGVLLMFAASVLGAASALYDKYLLQPVGLTPDIVQFWYQINLAVILGLVRIFQNLAGLSLTAFVWRWTIIPTGLLLVISDWFYFSALHEPGVLISILSPLRRLNAIFSFIIGGIIFREGNKRKKFIALLVIAAGVAILYSASFKVK
ncbi:MAG: hypothetical protein A2096_01420 [Spirochaetes bacterium GWF1_41_5]|nr:MAG: hypothetical protein A2096_01420 [Spirochaetes bacterium GWF1_41_5]